MPGDEVDGRMRIPSSRTLATVAFIVLTAVLILQLGIWYFAGLILLYLALDVSQRLKKRRDARIELAIATTAERAASSILFKGRAKHCERAAWIARRQGWLAMPITGRGLFRRSTILVWTVSASPLAALLTELHKEKLITRLELPENLPRAVPQRSAGKKRPPKV